LFCLFQIGEDGFAGILDFVYPKGFNRFDQSSILSPLRPLKVDLGQTSFSWFPDMDLPVGLEGRHRRISNRRAEVAFCYVGGHRKLQFVWCLFCLLCVGGKVEVI